MKRVRGSIKCIAALILAVVCMAAGFANSSEAAVFSNCSVEEHLENAKEAALHVLQAENGTGSSDFSGFIEKAFRAKSRGAERKTAPESERTDSEENKNPILVIAHRGASNVAPEDTLSAFREAWKIGADGFETDIQITADGKLVAQHNYTIDGNSDGSGFVYELTLEELKTYDFGSWKGEEFTGERIATLQECLQVAGDFELINLEIKAPKQKREVYLQEFTDAIEKSGLKDKILVSSFDPSILQEVKHLAPDIRVGLLTFSDTVFLYLPVIPKCIPVDKPLDEITKEDLTIPPAAVLLMSIGVRGSDPAEVGMELLHSISAIFPGATWEEVEEEFLLQRDMVAYVDSLDFELDYLHCEVGTLLRIPDLVEEMHARGIGVNVWTPNTVSELEKVFALHPDGVITDEAERALGLLSEIY